MIAGRAGTPEMTAPDSPAPVKAFRAWAVRDTPEGIRLRSIWFPGFWPPFERVEAECNACLFRRWRHRAPKPRHSCGIYALKAADDVWEWAVDHTPPGRRPIVAGEVWCWGTVVEGTRGYRCQYAYPASFLEARFAAPAGEAFYLESLARVYGVPGGS